MGRNIKISQADYSRLKTLGKKWYSAEDDDEPPPSPERIVHDLIEQEWRQFKPRKYQTTGFDRQ